MHQWLPLSTLIDYLAQKREALSPKGAADRRRRAWACAAAQSEGDREGRSGVRRIRIRDFQVISDSLPDFAGYDLGPSSPELVLGGLASCLNHSCLIQAAVPGVPIESIEVEVEGIIEPQAGSPGHENTPVYPQNLSYVVRSAFGLCRRDQDAPRQCGEVLSDPRPPQAAADNRGPSRSSLDRSGCRRMRATADQDLGPVDRPLDQHQSGKA
jgi:uncharacterized OsmC-like protein